MAFIYLSTFFSVITERSGIFPLDSRYSSQMVDFKRPFLPYGLLFGAVFCFASRNCCISSRKNSSLGIFCQHENGSLETKRMYSLFFFPLLHIHLSLSGKEKLAPISVLIKRNFTMRSVVASINNYVNIFKEVWKCYFFIMETSAFSSRVHFDIFQDSEQIILFLGGF